MIRKRVAIPLVLVIGLAIALLAVKQWDWTPKNIRMWRQVCSLKPGDLVEDVQQQLRAFGSSELMMEADLPKHIRSSLGANPKYNPDGVDPNDRYLGYRVKTAQGSYDEAYLQFRNGKLINFDPAWFKRLAGSR